MEGEKLIRVNLELGEGSLEKLGAVLDKLRLVLEAGSSPVPGTRETVTMTESGENTAFDPVRFSALEEGASLSAALPERKEADSTAPLPFRQMAESPGAGREVGQGPALPPSAGFVPQGGDNAYDEGRAALRERLVTQGPAPLTAEAVSLAFRRDDRRYDNGFPLY